MPKLLAAGLVTGTACGQFLPPPPAPRPGQVNPLPTEVLLFVREYHFEGNHAFSSTELAAVTAPYANREVTSDDMEQARRAVSVHYINHGYVNSGAILPDQNPTNGIVTLRIIEGVLSGIDIHGNGWLRDGYVRSRLERWSKPPLNLNELKEGLQLLRQNPNVQQINAELKPGSLPGESLLDVRVADQQPFRLGLQADNQRPPSVGSEEIWLLASDLNLTGHGDPLDLRYGVVSSGPDGFGFSGTRDMAGSYLLPVTRYDTTLGFHASRLNTGLAEEQFLPLDITSLTSSYGVVLRQPFYQTANHEAALAVAFDRRQNDTTLLGEPFNISPGAVGGRMVVSVLRVSQEWTQRSQNSVLALRSTFNFGLDVLDATDDRIAGNPDGKFVSWSGQGQFVQRLFNTQNQLILRAAGQWTTEPLLALEQISVGGAESVRGYRENQLVRDRGLLASVEFRLPVLFDKAGSAMVQVAPFFDFGGGWDVHGSSSPTTLYSTGLGLLITPNRHLNAQLYWGHPWRHVEISGERDAQDLGLHFRVNIDAF